MLKLLFAKCAGRLCLWLAASCWAPAEEDAFAVDPAADVAESCPVVVPIVPEARVLIVQPGADGGSVALLFADASGAPVAAALVRRPYALVQPATEVPPRPLNLEAERTRADADLGAMQRRYRVLLEEGRLDEAAALAAELTARDEDRAIIPADLVEPAASAGSARRHHQVGYGPAAQATGFSGRSAASRPVDWQGIAKRPISFDFDNASLVEVASFFRYVAGVPVRIDLPADRLGPGVPGIYARCTGKPTAEALQVVLASCGLGYVVEEGQIRITEPQTVERLLSQGRRQFQEAWHPSSGPATAIRPSERRF